jgi:hypothetical protein
MQNGVPVVEEQQEQRDQSASEAESSAEGVQVFHERELSEESLFYATDERGCESWFVRLAVAGLFPRRVGPFVTKEQAVALFEDFLGEIVMGPLLDVENDMRGGQVCLVEGVPRLTATTNGARCLQ